MDYETILTDIGGFGRVQMILFLTLSFTSFKAVLDLEVLSMGLHTTPFRCLQQNSSGYEEQMFGKHCQITRTIYTNDTTTEDMNVTEKCTMFEFKHEIYSRSLVEEYGLVCDNAWKTSTMISIFFLGNAIGMLAGTLGDKIGRKKILVIGGILDIITTILPIFMPTYETQLFSRFLKGLPAAVYFQGLLIMEELIEEKHRAILGNLYWLFWCIGYMSSGWVVYLFRDWRTIQLFTSVFCLNYIIIFIVVPESPRWNVLRGKTEEAAKTFKKMAKWNGVKLEKSYFKKMLNDEEVNTETGQIKELWTYKGMRKKTIVICYILVMFAFCYFGLSTDATFVTKNIALNTIFTGLIEIPSSIIGWLLSDKYGRRMPILIMTVISGLCVIGVPIIPKTNIGSIFKAVTALTGKCLLTAAYCIMDFYAAELYPTSIRNNGSFLSACLAMVGNIIAPFINALANTAHYLPGLIFGIFSIISAFTVISLPETKGMPLPETTPEAEVFVRGKEKAWKNTYHQKRNYTEENDHDLALLKV